MGGGSVSTPLRLCMGGAAGRGSGATAHIASNAPGQQPAARTRQRALGPPRGPQAQVGRALRQAKQVVCAGERQVE